MVLTRQISIHNSDKVADNFFDLKDVSLSVQKYCYTFMNNSEKTEEFYKRLKAQLEDNFSWPSTYLYKFIVPSDPAKVAAIKDIFADTSANLQTKESSKGTFTSVSVKVRMKSPDAVIEKYLEVSKVEGVISL